MEFISVKEWAENHAVSERTARNYCAQGKIEGAFLVGKTWNIPADAELPERKKRKSVSPLLATLREQKEAKTNGGIYHRVQIDLTYNSNHIEGSRLTHDQTRYIFETNTIGIGETAVNVDDIIETTNHFRAIDYIIDETEGKLTERYIKHLHYLLKSGTSDERKDWFRVGEYKQLPNEVGGMDTAMPEDVHKEMRALLDEYNCKKRPAFEDILDFHHKFESIHPFQDGNGRVGRLIMFRECLRNGYVPFIITDELKMFYYNGLRNWPGVKGYLTDTCLTAQDIFKRILDKFRIPYAD
ncbi:MAG: Fic family protein [Bacteroidales bacterium]|nr:Fic family protein [Bacteroidales bacterium]